MQNFTLYNIIFTTTLNDLENNHFKNIFREKEKLLVTSMFSFSHNIFFHSQKQISIFQSHSFCHMLSIWTSLKICQVANSEHPNKKIDFSNALFTHSLIRYFETVPISKKLQMTTEMWLLKAFKKQIP